MKDPLGVQTLQRAIARADRLEGELSKAHYSLRQGEAQNRDLVRMLAALLRKMLAAVTADEVVLTLEEMGAEGKNPKLVYRLHRENRTLTLRLTPFPDSAPNPADTGESPRKRLIIGPGEEGA